MMRETKRTVLSLLMLVLAAGCGTGQKSQSANSAENSPANNSAPQDPQPKTYGYTVVDKYPHDPGAFTQGLQLYQGFLYESTGLNGHSSIRKVDLKTGKVLRKTDLAPQYFAEGLTVLNKKVYQLTWTTKVGFIYDVDTFNPLGQFTYDWEGWGMTNDGRYLIMSDGSNKLRFVDPETFAVVRTIEVFRQGRPLEELNELEYINGEIYSNIWHDDMIARINPADGKLLGLIDLRGLGSGLNLGSEDVLNGIAYDPASNCLLVTGKRWPALFRIRLK
jgi:glutaminyl-peptide cyclotransferase